jgi:hypothetical protein
LAAPAAVRTPRCCGVSPLRIICGWRSEPPRERSRRGSPSSLPPRRHDAAAPSRRAQDDRHRVYLGARAVLHGDRPCGRRSTQGPPANCPRTRGPVPAARGSPADGDLTVVARGRHGAVGVRSDRRVRRADGHVAGRKCAGLEVGDTQRPVADLVRADGRLSDRPLADRIGGDVVPLDRSPVDLSALDSALRQIDRGVDRAAQRHEQSHHRHRRRRSSPNTAAILAYPRPAKQVRVRAGRPRLRPRPSEVRW